MLQFKIAEYADMHFLYGELNGNLSATILLNAERFLEQLPHGDTFVAVAPPYIKLTQLCCKIKQWEEKQDPEIINVKEYIFDLTETDHQRLLEKLIS